MTPELCEAYCFEEGSFKFYALQYGEECWCGEAGTAYDRLGELDDTECDYACTGDASTDCGGYDAFHAFEYGALAQPAGHLGCYGDAPDRVFGSGFSRSSGNTAESCKENCGTGGFAYYGLQYGEECFCGLAGEDYTRYGESDACGYRCPGDADYICGGYFAMDIFSLDETATPAPVTPAPSTRAPSTIAPATTVAPVTTAPTTSAPVTVAPATTGPVTPSPSTASPSTASPSTASPSTASPSTASPSTASPSTAAPSTASPSTASPSTTSPSTAAPSTASPSTASPSTAAPSTAAPSTAAPSTAAPSTAAPSTAAPSTAAPSTAAPSTAAPSTAAPSTAAPSTAAPSTAAPSTAAPSTAAPSTAAPVTPAPFSGSVLVDLVPCLFSDSTVEQSNEDRPGLYVMSLFFKGYWTPKTEEFVVSQTDDLTALLVDSSDSVPHGKCNAVYVGFEPSAEQSAALTAYSAQFKVRIVFFPSSLTHSIDLYKAKLGIDTYFADPLQFPAFVQLSDVGGTKVSITQPDLQTDPNIFDPPLFSYPVILSNVSAGVEVLAEFADDSGTPIIAGFSSDQENAAMLSYTGDDGHEELHIFFTIGWFDAGAWPWAHYFNEWATKGIFLGERRFYLGAVVDDLFLSTPEFEYDGDLNEADVAQRCTADDLSSLLSVQDSLNAQYSGSSIITEFAFNGGGIAEQVSQTVDDITYVPDYEETEVTDKGTLWFENGQGTVHDINWLATNVPLMQDDMADGTWEANDELLAAVISYLDTPSTFYHGHHTLIHLSRDQLRESDCVTEDTGNVQIALMTGMWDSDNYNWRSMVSPGITGLFNENCLESAAANLMTCYPGDNTFDGTVDNTAILINEDNQFHSIYTTVANNGYDGAQIVPRFATFVYFNCVTGECLVNENEYIRRFVCECTPLDPSIDEYICTSTADECVDDDGSTEIQSFGSIDALFEAEASTTTRYMLTGRRDKYMFHQANIIPAGDVGDGTQSLLDYWYEQVMATFSSLVTFPVKTIKFDDLCTEFQLHEALDASGAYVTMALDAAGDVTGFSYVSGSGAGLVPLTVPTASVDSIPVTDLSVEDTETYGTDTTYYLKDDDAAAAVRVGTKPDAGDLAVVPDLVSDSAAAAMMVVEDPADAEERAQETAEANEANTLVGADGATGLLADDGLVDADVAAEAAVEEAADEGSA